jgi:DNA-directed RNA polymerase II subunit RPB1
MTSGVPKFQELINATKKTRSVNNIIYFKHKNSNIKGIRETVGHSIVGLMLKDISKNIEICIDKQPELWYEAFKILYNDKFADHPHCISLKINMEKIFEFKLSLQQISEYIEKEYDDLFCVFSPPMNGQIDIFVDTANIVLPENRLLFINQENAVNIYMEEVVQTTLENIYICGIPAITEVFYLKSPTEWYVETNGFYSKQISKQYSSFKQLLTHPDIDYTRTISNNVWDIYEVLDIEAARQFLIEEFMSIMDGINICQSILLVDRMTFSGIIVSISRHTLKADESGPMGKASFEETVDNFLNAGAQGQHEPTKGVSAAIICGKRANIGTNSMKVIIDIDNLPDPISEETIQKTRSSYHHIHSDQPVSCAPLKSGDCGNLQEFD